MVIDKVQPIEKSAGYFRVNTLEYFQIKRSVAYCRVLSDHDDQLNSLANQKEHWEEYIKDQPDMEFCGLYVDEGITGTSTLKRDGFKQNDKGCDSGPGGKQKNKRAGEMGS